jgi:ribonucleoside-diphosphate reductase alpha chain
VKSEHYPVFDCAIGDRAIHYTGHVKMMGAVQPFISGAISKTVNLPETATIDEVAQLYVESWKLGVKAIAIYRDNCKVAQPLSGKADASQTLPVGAPTVVSATRTADPAPPACRRSAPRSAASSASATTRATSTSGCTTTARPGDIFVDIAKEGHRPSAGLMNCFMIAVSIGLQYGVPLEVWVSKFAHMRFEPSGMTNDADIRIAKSIPDYVFRWMGKKFLDVEQQEEGRDPLAGGASAAGSVIRWRRGEALRTAGAVRAAPPGQTALFNNWEDAVECAKCGGADGEDRELLHMSGLRD